MIWRKNKLSAVKALIGLALAALVVGGVWVGLSMITPVQNPDTLTIKFSAMDKLAGSQDATTTKVGIYRPVGDTYELQETVTCDALQKESGLSYTTGEKLYFKVYDSSDTSLCTQYLEATVPEASPANVYDGSFQMTIWCYDRGDTAYDTLIKYHNNTAIAASGTIDVTNNAYTSNYAEIDFEIRNLVADKGYRNTYNFLRGYDNNHYIYFSASGTGWDSVNLLTKSSSVGSIEVYDKASVRYFCIQLASNAIDRDQLSEGIYSPDGTISIPLVFDFTGFADGDSVTFTYGYYYYASWSHFKDSGSWGVDAATNPASSETVTIQY